MDLFQEVKYLRHVNEELKKKYPNIQPLSTRNSTMLSKLGLVDQQREDEKYEELTKNIPRKTKWFGVHALVDEAAEEEAKKKAEQEVAKAKAAHEASLAAEQSER